MSLSSYDSLQDSPYYDDDDREYAHHYSDDDSSGDFAHSARRVHREGSESSLELEKFFVDDQSTKRLLPLKELCSRFVGQNFPFGVVQLYPTRVPEDVQRRVAFWSFPTDEKKLLEYARLMGGATEHDVERARKTKVNNVTQSGMYLTGTVAPSPSTDHYKSYLGEGRKESFRAYVQFDRGCITATKCSCGEQNWCRHVLALCLARLDERAPLQLHPPISETLTNLDRDQLQKLVQYSLEKLPLEGVAAVQEIANKLLDKGSEINQTPGAPDLTAGGSPDDKPVWQMDTNVIIGRLNSAYDTKLDRSSHAVDHSTSTLQRRKVTLLGIKDFTSDIAHNTPSELTTLLFYEDDNLAIALKWALEKLAKELSKAAYPVGSHLQQDTEADTKWVEWCFCRMLLPVMQIFCVSSAISDQAREDVTECLAQCLQQDLPSPIVELLSCFKEIATGRVLADTNGCRHLLSRLQQAVSKCPPLPALHDSNVEEPSFNYPALLHCAMAVVRHIDFRNDTCSPNIEDILVNVCNLVFSANLTDAASLQELVAIRVDHGLQEISLPLLLEYGTTLLHCMSNPDLAAELVFRFLGSQLTRISSTDDLVYWNWAENAIIRAVDEAETFNKACPEVKSKLGELALKWLQQTSRALERDPNPIATLTGMWSMMRLVCRCGSDCLKVVSQMTQELIGLMSATLPKATPMHEIVAVSNAMDPNLPLDVIADCSTGLLVDLFVRLPADNCQELFTTLRSAYPTPVDVKRSLELGRRTFDDWQHCLLNGAYVLTTRLSYTFLPEELSMKDFELQLESASQNHHGFGLPSHRQTSTRPEFQLQSDSERAELLQICRTRCTLSDRHVSFLELLHKRLQEADAPFQFQLQLLVAQVYNCMNYDWACKDGFGDHNLRDSLLASNNIRFSLQALKDMWKFSISPQCTLDLVAAVHDQAPPQLSDVMSDTLTSVLDCGTCPYQRIFMLMHMIGAKPGHMLQAVDVAISSESGKDKSSDERRTTFIQCAEALGKAYNQHKDSGSAEESLLHCRVKAVELLHKARSIPVARSTHQQERLYHASSSYAIDVQNVMQIVHDSGQQALSDLLPLLVMLPGECLLPSLEALHELCNSCHKDNDQAGLLMVSPFKETVAAMLEKRKNEIKSLAASQGQSSRVKRYLDDLNASFQFLGNEVAFTAFMQSIAATLHNAGIEAYYIQHR